MNTPITVAVRVSIVSRNSGRSSSVRSALVTDRTVKAPTNYGPVDVELTQCDGPECATMGQTQYMVGWFRLGPRGMEITTMGQTPDPMDFCSLTCLHKAVSMMTGN